MKKILILSALFVLTLAVAKQQLAANVHSRSTSNLITSGTKPVGGWANINWVSQTAADVPKGVTVPANSFYNFAKLWGAADAKCKDGSYRDWIPDFANPKSIQLASALKGTACQSIINGSPKALDTVTITAKICNAQIKDFADGIPDFKKCWDAGFGGVGATADTIWEQLQFVKSTDGVAQGTNKQNEFNWGTISNCIRTNNCWNNWSEFDNNQDANYEADRLAAVALIKADCGSIGQAADFGMDEAKRASINTCLEKAYKNVITNGDQGTIECLQRCYNPITMFGYLEQDKTLMVDGEQQYEHIDSEFAKQKSDLFNNFRTCVEKDQFKDFLWYDWTREFKNRDQHRTAGYANNFDQDNNANGGAPYYDEHADTDKQLEINETRNCLYQSQECLNLKNFFTNKWNGAGNLYYERDDIQGLSSLEKCRLCLNRVYNNANNLDKVVITSAGAADHEDYTLHENLDAYKKYVQCFNKLQLGWEKVVMQHYASNATLMTIFIALVGIVSLLF